MADQSKLWYLENINLFEGLSKGELTEVEARTTMKVIPKSEYIFFPEDPSTSLFFLKEGRIKIGTYSEDGKEITKAILQAGEMFGELSLFGEEKRTDFAQAMDSEVMICAMNMEDKDEMMSTNLKLGTKITKLVGFRLRRIERRLESLVFKNARTRIIEFIIELAEEKGSKVGEETLVKHFLTHQDIANLTATSRQTVTTLLNELREQDLIYFDRKSILIRDLEKLK